MFFYGNKRKKPHRLLVVLTLILFCDLLPVQLHAAVSRDYPSNSIFVPRPKHPMVPQLSNKKRFVKILSIDGGGVRSIIPAELLASLEARLPEGTHLADCFDIIAGASAGGIIALMLSTPDINGKPKYNAAFISAKITELCQETFSQSLWQIIKSGNGWWDAKYDEKVLQNKLKYYFNDLLLSQTLNNVIIPSYGIEKDKAYFFKASRARNELPQDCYLRELAYATSAAPTYFRPARLLNKSGEVMTLIDGGVSANNPTMAAAVHAVELYGNDIELFIVSIGTGTSFESSKDKLPYDRVKSSGKLGWVKEIISVLMNASNEIIDYEMYYVLNFRKSQYYFRFQSVLEPEHAELDNISNNNLAALKTYAQALIKKNDHVLDYIAQVLYKGYFPNPEEDKRDEQAFR